MKKWYIYHYRRRFSHTFPVMQRSSNQTRVSKVAVVVKNLLSARDAREAGLILGQKIPWVGSGNCSSILPGKFHGQRSLVVDSPWGLKSWTQLSVHTQSTEELNKTVNKLTIMNPVEPSPNSCKRCKTFIKTEDILIIKYISTNFRFGMKDHLFLTRMQLNL